METKLSKLLAPVYYPFYKDWTTRTWILSGGRMSSKGDTAYTKCALKLVEAPAQVNVYVPLENLIKEGPMNQTKKVLDRIGIPYKEKGKYIILPNGSQFFFKGMAFENRKRKAEAFKGSESTLPLLAVVFDELAALEDPKRMFTIMDTHMRQAPQFICIFNPPSDRNSWLLSWRDGDHDETTKTLHTTLYDLADTNWPFVEDAIKEAENRKRISKIDWEHDYLGLPVGGDDVAFNVLPQDILIGPDEIRATHYDHFIVFGDIGNADATAHLLFGVHANGLHLLRTYYYDGRLEEYLPHSEQVAAYNHWLDEGALYPSEEYFDNLNFSLEVKRHRPKQCKVYSIKDKKRHEIYTEGVQAISSGFIKIFDAEDNQIVLQQLLNANTETVLRNGKEVKMIKKVDNRIAPIEKQIHALDALLYAIYYKYRKLTYFN